MLSKTLKLCRTRLRNTLLGVFAWRTAKNDVISSGVNSTRDACKQASDKMMLMLGGKGRIYELEHFLRRILPATVGLLLYCQNKTDMIWWGRGTGVQFLVSNTPFASSAQPYSLDEEISNACRLLS